MNYRYNNCKLALQILKSENKKLFKINKIDGIPKVSVLAFDKDIYNLEKITKELAKNKTSSRDVQRPETRGSLGPFSKIKGFENGYKDFKVYEIT